VRILFVVPNIVSYHFFIGEVCAALRAAGHDPHAVCSMNGSFGGGEKADERATMHALDFPRGMNPLHHLRAARALDALVRELKPDLIHTHFSAALFTTAVARRSHWPLTHGTYHGASFPMMRGLKRHILRFAEAWAASRFDDVWVLTPDDRKALQTAAPSARVHVYRSPGIGCLLQHFHPDRVPASERAALRKELGIPADAVVFVFVGRLVDFKGFGLTVRAFLRLAAEQPNFRLLNVGPADPMHPSGLTPEEQSAREKCPQIIDVGMRKDVWRYLAISDVMAFPSQREGMPVCIMEALAMGVPVITADSRGCRDVVRDEIDGLVLRDPGVETMAAAMRRLGDDAAFRCRLGVAALADRERFSRDGYVREQVELYGAHVAAARTAGERQPPGSPFWKRAFDFGAASLGLIALAPVIVVTGILVAMRLGRPVLFKQPRPGLGGRLFTMWKFRTMTDARDAQGHLLPDGERLPPFGTWLRSTSLDELPELWNVVRGEMSLVGPRPLLTVYLPRYSPEQQRRHDLLPGITGWAQVNGRNAQSWERKIALDTWYVDHVSPRLDLHILWLTIARVLKRDGIAAGPEHVTSPHFWGSEPHLERQGEAEAAALAPAWAHRVGSRAMPGTPRFLAALVAADFCFLAFAAALGWWLRRDPLSLIGDNRLVSDFSALQLLVVAWLAAAIFHARKPAAETPLWQQPRLVWLLIALGFCFLTADQLFDLHEGMDNVLHTLFRIRETAWTDRIDDFIVMGYGLCGLGVLWAYRHELAKFFGLLPFLAFGFVFFGLSAVCDVASNRPDFIPALFANPILGDGMFRAVSSADQILTLIAEGFFAAGFYYAWRQARRAGGA
jgi:lipopolysaccharide/colanic/teichoic acid biosynthesis glycosyltransferase